MLTSFVVWATMGTMANGPKVEELAWMAGSWRCEIWGGTFEERWSEPAGGSMIGMGRHIAGGKTTFMEFLSIEPDKDGKLIMWILLGSPSKGPKNGVPFKLTSSKAGEAVFENPKNDFPSKITYRRRADGLWCRIEGVQDGKAAKDDFEFKAVGK